MAAASTISEGTAIRGRLTLDGDLEVHGQIEGSIAAGGDVTLTSTALLKGDVASQGLVVAGAVNGNLQGRVQVVLETGARVQGDVSAPTVGIRPGALIRGHVDSVGGAGGPARKPRAAVAQKSAAHEAAEPVAAAPPAAKPSARRAAPAPVVPKAAARGKKAPPKQRKAAPAPQVPAIKKRTKKAAKRRAR